jgi:prolipoprotein diacylglyceryl transferase
MPRLLAAASAPSRLSFIPSPPVSGVHLGSLDVHFYGLMYVVGITLAVWITARRWVAAGGDRELVYDVVLWAVPAGIVGARIYFDVTTPFDITPQAWWGPLAVWRGGLGVWGGIAAGAVVGAWRVRRSGASVGLFMNAAAPALLVAQAIGRVGNYFNQELFGKPSALPWAVEISPAARLAAGLPAADLKYATFQPSFLYELVFDLAWAAVLIWLGHHRRIRPQGLFALYVAGYSGYRIFEETIRIDSSAHVLGMRLNFFIATAMTVVGLVWFFIAQYGDILIPSRHYGEPGAGRSRQDPDQEHGAAARSRAGRAAGDGRGSGRPLGLRRGQGGDRRLDPGPPQGQALPPPA